MQKKYLIIGLTATVIIAGIWFAERQTVQAPAPAPTSAAIPASAPAPAATATSAAPVVLNSKTAPASVSTSTSSKSSAVRFAASSLVIEGAAANPTSTRVGAIAVFEWNAPGAASSALVWSVRFGDGTGLTQICPDPLPSDWTNNDFTATHSWNAAGTYQMTVSARDCRSDASAMTSTAVAVR